MINAKHELEKFLAWCDRAEYDGSEWWVHNKLPEIPKNLL